LRLTKMPTVRVECGYLTNPSDANRLSDGAFRDALAEAVAAAIVAYFEPADPSDAAR
jgi:N-acetylmuramoyl-L-alanine amidase